MSNNKTFLIGLGAQKTGTTWLHRYLNSSPSADFGRMKEYHVFDALHVPGSERYRYERVQPWEYVRHVFSRGSRPLIMSRMQNDTGFYFDYFGRLLERNGTDLTGDITPAYSGLSSSVLKEIREGFAQRNIRTRAVFIMRDPFERYWSAIRMFRRKYEKRAGARAEADWKVFEKSFQDNEAQVRSRYDRTLEAIYGAFEPEEYRLFLFEEFFRDETVMQLSELLGMNLPAADFTVRVNTSRKAGHEIPDELRKRFVDYYRSAYLAAFDAFGEEKIRSLWPNASLV